MRVCRAGMARVSGSRVEVFDAVVGWAAVRKARRRCSACMLVVGYGVTPLFRDASPVLVLDWKTPTSMRRTVVSCRVVSYRVA
jgi:hypothetical protein